MYIIYILCKYIYRYIYIDIYIYTYVKGLSVSHLFGDLIPNPSLF